MLIKVNDHLVLNVDAIAAANWSVDGSRWRIVMRGHGPDSPVIYLTETEMTHILENVEVPKMVALMRAAGAKPRSSQSRPGRPNGDPS